MTGCQLTIDDILAERYISKLTQKQIDIIRFLEQGYYQAFIARRMHISKGYVNETVKTLENTTSSPPSFSGIPTTRQGK